MNATPLRRTRAPSRIGLSQIAAAGIVGAIVLAFLAANSAMFAALFKRLFKTPSRPLRKRGSFAALRRTILGTRKHTVAEVLGPPPAAGAAGKPSAPGQPHYWYAGTWYYPLDPAEKSAVAIEFSQGVATKVDVILPPRNTRCS